MPNDESASRPEGPVIRRSELRRKLGSDRSWHRSPAVVQATTVAAIFAILTWVVCDWSRQQSRWVEGQVVTSALLNRIDYQLENETLTRQQRDLERRNAPRVYEINRSWLESIRAAIEGLPQAVAGKASLAEVDERLVRSFSLDAKALAQLQPNQDAQGPTEAWTNATEKFIAAISSRSPLITREEFQRFATAAGREVVVANGEPNQPPRTQQLGRAAIELPDGDASSLRTRLVTEALDAGFPADAAPIVVSIILNDPQPTIRCDEVATLARAEAAAAAVRSVLEAHPRGEVIAMPGDALTRDRLMRLDEERAQAMVRIPAIDRWSNSVGLLGLCALLATALCVGLAVFRPTVLGDVVKLSLLLGGMLLLTVAAAVISASFPRFTVLVCMALALFAASSLALLYDRRTALLAAAGQSAMLGLALDETLGFMLATLLTAAAYIALLREVRHRSALVRATTITALIAAAAIGSVGLVQTPLGTGGVLQVIGTAALAAVGTLVTGFMLVGVLPTMERIFGVVTGLTLAELRDPRQPLLRQLQQKAPGTWTHSLQVANVAEAAAESIGADGLLAYVGALYHDIGKMNKPEYFVENQSGGHNRHDSITPAMSLLVIIGHVKDGVELAAEYRLPKAIRHMIESHHGTTMVEYFFHQAQRRAASAGEDMEEIDEHTWRYPGPKPQTREAAILLLCDAVESATRTLADPTPARIEQLVHSIARRRLEDGQFDDSPLTFRELRTLEETISKSLCSIYHGRIIYPSTARDARAEGDDGSDGDEPIADGDSARRGAGERGHSELGHDPHSPPKPGTRRAVA